MTAPSLSHICTATCSSLVACEGSVAFLAPFGSSSGSCTPPTLQASAPFLPPLLRRAALLLPAHDGSQKQPARAFYLCGQARGGCMLSVRAVGRAQSWCRACSAAATRCGRAGRRTVARQGPAALSSRASDAAAIRACHSLALALRAAHAPSGTIVISPCMGRSIVRAATLRASTTL